MTSNPIEIPDDYGYNVNQFILPDHIDKRSISSILIPGGMIRDRTKALAREITREYGQKDVYLLCVLKGAHQFFSDLMHFMQDQMSATDNAFGYDFIPASSYEDTQSTGNLSIGTLKDPSVLENKYLILVEDIIDSGHTMVGKNYVKGQVPIDGLIGHFMQYNPLEISVASMIVKRNSESNNFQPRFVGFSIPDKFVVGYGLDYNEHLREIGHLCVLSEAGIKKYAQKNTSV
ncbi:hypothetical protein H8D36_00410 [archaeon]|nr:hypothetical protein [archaeon]